MCNSLVIVGTGVSAKQVYDFVILHNLFNIIGFAVDSKYKISDTFLDKPILSLENLKSQINVNETYLFVALSWDKLNSDRKYLYERLKKEGYKLANLISPLAVLKGKVVGDNCWINDYVVVQSDAVIENDVIIRELALIGNETQIKPHCFIGVNGIIGGGSIIGEQSFVGMRGTVFDKTIVGKKCIVGACAVVKRNMIDCSVCKTKLDSYIIKQYSEEEIEQKLVASKEVR